MTTKKRKLKKKNAAILAVILVAIILAITFTVKHFTKSDTTAEQGQMIEDQGNLELTIPDDQDTFGE